MKTLNHWFDEYSISHQNKINKGIHYICVPVIFFSIVGLLMSIPATFLEELIPGTNFILENWAAPVILLVLFFYVRLSFAMGIKMLIFSCRYNWKLLSRVSCHFMDSFIEHFCHCLDRSILWT